MYKKFSYKLTGVAPIVLHNGQMVDPQNPYAKKLKAISSKRTKTDDDHKAMAEIEWEAGLYTNKDKSEIVIPGDVMEAAFVTAARSRKKGKIAQAAVFCEGDFTLNHNGPKTIKELSTNEDFSLKVPVRIGTAKIMRTRPIFRQWSCNITLNVDTESIDSTEVLQLLEHCGNSVGLCDWRPKYGRFSVEAI